MTRLGRGAFPFSSSRGPLLLRSARFSPFRLAWSSCPRQWEVFSSSPLPGLSYPSSQRFLLPVIVRTSLSRHCLVSCFPSFRGILLPSLRGPFLPITARVSPFCLGRSSSFRRCQATSLSPLPGPLLPSLRRALLPVIARLCPPVIVRTSLSRHCRVLASLPREVFSFPH